MARKGKINRKKEVDEDSRPVRPRIYKRFILIVCEDENTEPYYFRQIKKDFPEDTVYLKEIGTGLKPKGIVARAIKERNDLSEQINKSLDEVWIVFDRDDEGKNAKTLASFNEAWTLAESEKMEIAFSNEVFELWLLLHLSEVDPAVELPRAEIYKMIEDLIKSTGQYDDFVYNHGKSDVIDIVMEIGDENEAIKRARKLLTHHGTKSPIDANPCTYVHNLVNHLRDLIAWYSYNA